MSSDTNFTTNGYVKTWATNKFRIKAVSNYNELVISFHFLADKPCGTGNVIFQFVLGLLAFSYLKKRITKQRSSWFQNHAVSNMSRRRLETSRRKLESQARKNSSTENWYPSRFSELQKMQRFLRSLSFVHFNNLCYFQTCHNFCFICYWRFRF